MDRMSQFRLAMALCALLLVTAGLRPAVAQEGERPTVQDRFAEKSQRFHAHLNTAAPIRDDFYHSLGAGLDVGYHFNESLGAELRWLWLQNWEAGAADQIREETGYVPDARPQEMLLSANGRYSVGYGKVLVADDFMVHFDPQLVGGLGGALAEGKRVIPTVTTGLSVLTHFQHGVQAKLDLQAAFQLEKRTRGWVGSVSFVPTLGIGFQFGGPGESR